jgi:hypothetical protein
MRLSCIAVQMYYSWREIRVGRESGAASSSSVLSKQNITDDTFKKLTGMLNSLEWNFAYTKKDQQAHSDMCSTYLPHDLNNTKGDST